MTATPTDKEFLAAKEALAKAEKDFLTPEHLTNLAKLISQYKAKEFDEIGSITSDDFDLDTPIHEMLERLSDANKFTEKIIELLKLKLKIQEMST